MSNRHIAAFGEIELPFDDNEWLASNKDFKRAKQLWEKSSNDKENPDYKKACALVQKHFDCTFSKANMINYFAEKVADLDEDGWTNVSAENIIYGKRKSVFKKYNDATYEEEDVDSIAVINLDYYERDYDDEIDTSSIVDSPTITFAVLITTDLKDDFQNQRDLEQWEEKNDFDITRCFDFSVSDETTAYIDEDGYESSGYSFNGGINGYLVNEKGEDLSKFSQRINDALTYGNIDIDVDDETQSYFENISNGEFELVKEAVNAGSLNANIPLIDGVDITKPLSIVFSAAFFEKDAFNNIFGQVFAIDKIKDKTSCKEGHKELIFFLAAQGADLQQKVANISYLTMSFAIDSEITEFLISFGFDPERDSEALCFAASSCDLDLVKKLIDLGAHVNPKGFSTTPLLYAAQGESEESTLSEENQKIQIEIIDLLLEKGRKLKHVDDGGDTALTNAVRCNHVLIAKHLIDKGIQVNGAKSKNALKPLQIARDKKFKDLEDMLLSNGAAELKEEPKIPKGKAECPDCNKVYAQSTIKKWGGICGTCYRKKNPRPKPKKPKKNTYKASAASKSDGCFETLDGCNETMDGCFDLLKMLLILGFVVWFFGALIWAMFTA